MMGVAAVACARESGAAAGPIAVSAAMREVLSAVRDVAAAHTTVLLLGESGTGKEVIARAIARWSPRANGPWVAVNCAALPSDLLESELFGHERGAFTGAAERRIGRIERAHGGTLLLDEISELPLPLQAKLLRALQEREIDRVGGTRPIPVDVRVIATSNRSLEEMVAAKTFRADLYYRLCVFPIVVPPLRDRPDDVAPLARHFLAQLAGDLGRPAPVLSKRAEAALRAYPFPGNARELRNLIERALVRSRTTCLEPQDLLPAIPGAAPAARVTSEALVAPATWALPLDLAVLERLAIEEALRRVGGNRTHAARLLNISLRTLRNKLRTWRQSADAGPARVTSPLACTSQGDGDDGPDDDLRDDEQAA